MTSSSRRAAAATTVFAAAGIASACRGPRDWEVAAPLGASYALLVVNTYCSVRCFASLVPPGLRHQGVLDALLVALYLGLAASLGDAARFAAIGALLFAVATLKYAALVGRFGATERLVRKLRVDAVGTIAAVLALVAASEGHPHAAGWALLALSAAANAWVLWWRPLYRLDRPRSGEAWDDRISHEGGQQESPARHASRGPQDPG